jgi:hypothetical protein
MLNKMSMLLAATAVVALSGGIANAQMATGGPQAIGPNDSANVSMATEQSQSYQNGYNRGYDDGVARNQRNDVYRADVYMAPHGLDGGLITVGFGDVAFGYRDGYWDRGHTWHHWRNDADFRNYRGQHARDYHDWNHDRDSDNGWHDAR